jgi:group I intron endonuclease
MIGIYKIINPNGKVYIGQSVRLQYRKNQYKNLNVPQQPKIYNSIKKYSWENHIFEVIEECSIEQLNERETYWKQYYLDQVKGDWNLLLFCGMYDNGSGPLSEETKQKISDALKGRQAPWSTPSSYRNGKSK